jgi:hypothetical protein
VEGKEKKRRADCRGGRENNRRAKVVCPNWNNGGRFGCNGEREVSCTQESQPESRCLRFDVTHSIYPFVQPYKLN